MNRPTFSCCQIQEGAPDRAVHNTPLSESVSWHVRELQYRYWTSRRYQQAITKPNMSRRRKTGSVALFSMVGTPNPASTSHTQLQPSSAHTSARVREASRCYGNLLWAAYIRNLNPNFPTRPFQSLGHLNERIRVLETPGGRPVTVM